MTESQQIANLIETAACALDVCPRAVLLDLGLRRKNRIAVARRCVMFHLYKSGVTLDRVARIWKVSPECAATNIRLVRLMDDMPEYIAVMKALPPVEMESFATFPPANVKRHHAATCPV